MYHGLYVHTLGTLSEPARVLDLAVAAERAGWDAFFVSSNLLGPEGEPAADPWVLLSAIATATRRIRLGPLVAALPRVPPWTLARRTVTLDRLSGGRLTLGIGSGDDAFGEYSAFGQPADPRTLGAMVDEGLTVLTRLWTGAPVRFQGTHYRVRGARFMPRPRQQPRIPIWIGGAWPHPRPFARAAQWDGVFPNAINGELAPDDYAAIRAFITARRGSLDGFAVVHAHPMAPVPALPAPKALRAYAAAGVNWWLADIPQVAEAADVARFVSQGPPPKRFAAAA